MRERFLHLPIFVIAAAMAAPHLSSAAPEQPNFLVIVADDMGYSDAGCYGGEIQTPTLDRLANEGLRFTQFYSTGRCWPSRSCILTVTSMSAFAASRICAASACKWARAS